MQHTFRRLCFLTSLLKVQTQSTRFLFFSFYFLNQIHSKSSATCSNISPYWWKRVWILACLNFFRLSFLSCIIFFAFMIDLVLITRKFERMELNCSNTDPFGGYTWAVLRGKPRHQSFFEASLRNRINCVHCDDHFFIFISFPQFIYDLFHISLTLISFTGTYEPTIDLLPTLVAS